jgi:NAD(P)H-flavin reductase
MPHSLRTTGADTVSSWIAPRPWRVRANIRESHDTVTLELEPDDPFAFQPGQFTAELARWRARFDLTVEVTVDAAERTWHGGVGVVPGLIERVPFDPAGTVAFMVGPEIMMRFTVRALQQAGVPDERIFLSMERDMHCAAALCGHCQLGPFLICRDGPVLGYPRLAPWLTLREV